MKRSILFLCAIILYFANCSGPKPTEEVVEVDPASELEGVWELTQVTMTTADTSVTTTEFDSPTYKILVGDHWAFGRQVNDSTIMAGGGTFSYDGETYTEVIGYHAVSSVVGQTVNFDIELNGDTWHHVGNISDGEGNTTTLDETWVKVE